MQLLLAELLAAALHLGVEGVVVVGLVVAVLLDEALDLVPQLLALVALLLQGTRGCVARFGLIFASEWHDFTI